MKIDWTLVVQIAGIVGSLILGVWNALRLSKVESNKLKQDRSLVAIDILNNGLKSLINDLKRVKFNKWEILFF